jgi:SAM-dependent methyltransferase
MTEPDRIREYFQTTKWRASPGREFLARERTELLRASAAVLSAEPFRLRVCDIGCGGGGDLVAWEEWGVLGSSLAGTELLEERAQVARQRLPDADIRLVRGFDLPFDTATFDVSTASLVLSTIRTPRDRAHLLHEIARVTRPGGVILVYDFVVRKPWNRNVDAVTTRWLRTAWRSPDRVLRAAPFLPVLDVLLRLPGGIGRRMARWLPPTHRLWVWRLDGPITPPTDAL